MLSTDRGEFGPWQFSSRLEVLRSRRVKPPAAARFRVNGFLSLGMGFYVCGEIVEGAVRVGMALLWPMPGDDITIELVVRSVDFVDYPGGDPCIALGVSFDPDERADSERMLRELCDEGMVIDVAAAAAPAG
jgi:hypothetical protein